MSLRDDAEAIWRAGVAAVDSSAAIIQNVHFDGTRIRTGNAECNISKTGRIVIVGAGKAGAGMASGIESVLLPQLGSSKLSGWVNVPADCVRPLSRIHPHAARPAGINEPTVQAVDGTNEILRRIRAATQNDVCIVLLSGGASALLCSPVPEISLSDKLTVTRALAASGAPIHELNVVRTQLSRVKGGRLAAACNAGILIALIISDVIGDPLEIIGSGPTVATSPKARQALEILKRRRLLGIMPPNVIRFLRSRSDETLTAVPAHDVHYGVEHHTAVNNIVVPSNTIALHAPAEKARQLGYRVESLGSDNAGDAASEGRKLIQKMLAAVDRSPPDNASPICILSGGEPTVDLSDAFDADFIATLPGQSDATAKRSFSSRAGSIHESQQSAKGGRNQELVLAAIPKALQFGLGMRVVEEVFTDLCVEILQNCTGDQEAFREIVLGYSRDRSI